MIMKGKLPEIVTIRGKKKAKIPKHKKMAAARPYIIKEIFTPCCVGHATIPITQPGLPTTQLAIQDFLVDSSGLSKGGESVNPLIQMGLNDSRKIVFSIMPEACKNKFRVTRPPGVSSGYFSCSFGRTALHPVAGGAGFYDMYPAQVVFNGLAGSAPTITYAWFFITHGNNNAFYVYIDGEFSSNFTFSDIQIICRYPARNVAPKFDFYKLLSYNQPITINSPLEVCYAIFGYASPNLQDLGQIIEIV